MAGRGFDAAPLRRRGRCLHAAARALLDLAEQLGLIKVATLGDHRAPFARLDSAGRRLQSPERRLGRPGAPGGVVHGVRLRVPPIGHPLPLIAPVPPFTRPPSHPALPPPPPLSPLSPLSPSSSPFSSHSPHQHPLFGTARHMHADHHLGLLHLLELRAALRPNGPPLIVVGPQAHPSMWMWMCTCMCMPGMCVPCMHIPCMCRSSWVCHHARALHRRIAPCTTPRAVAGAAKLATHGGGRAAHAARLPLRPLRCRATRRHGGDGGAPPVHRTRPWPCTTLPHQRLHRTRHCARHTRHHALQTRRLAVSLGTLGSGLHA